MLLLIRFFLTCTGINGESIGDVDNEDVVHENDIFGN